jgi:hypothetical protein
VFELSENSVAARPIGDEAINAVAINVGRF